MPPEEAYGRVTNPERFQVLHTVMLGALERLEAEFEVRREEGYGLDEELERNFELARPTIRLVPVDLEAAPITAAFSAFPGLHVRFGKWWEELLPACGCDACGDSGEELAESLTRMVDSVVAGRFRESFEPSSRWPKGEIWGETGWRRGHGSLDDRSSSSRVAWKPWPRRSQPGS